jgi:hypothetical protein
MKQLYGKSSHLWLHRLKKVKFLVSGYWRGLREREALKDVETYCMFIGYPRSGHSLIGFLLDAHPDMVIALELHALYYLQLGVSRLHLYGLLLERSHLWAEKYRGEWQGYSYKVPNQWQGRFRKLRVIGDKKGDGTVLFLSRKPELLHRLRRTVNTKIKFIHVVRNPYDNIATISVRNKIDLWDTIALYSSLCETIAKLKRQIDSADLYEVRFESFVEQPRIHLAALCRFLGVECSDDYLDDCASIVFKSPRKTRHRIEWNPESIAVVKDKINQFPFLSGYAYQDGNQ